MWRLFIDSFKVSLKAVLLHNGNKFPFISLAHATNMKIHTTAWSFRWKKLIIMTINVTFDNLKVVALLLGMQLDYTKYCCFLCEWDSRDKKNYYEKKELPKQTSLTRRNKNVINILFYFCRSWETLFAPFIYFPIPSKWIKQAMDFPYVRNKFPKINYLGNSKSENYMEIVNNILPSWKVIGCNRRIKIHFSTHT